MDVNKLKLLHASHLRQRYALEDKIRGEYPQEIARLTKRTKGYRVDVETAAKHPSDKDRFPTMTVGGLSYADKKEAGITVIEACGAITSPDPVPLDEYRGFSMILAFGSYTREYRVTPSGALSHPVALGTDIRGNITRIDNILDGLPNALANC